MRTKKIKINKEKARHFLLSHQGLGRPHEFEGKAGIVEYVKRVGCIQFDPLNIAGHNQELVLQSRIPGFKANMLRELLYEDRKLMDGWDKNMSIYSVTDWPFFQRGRDSAKDSLGHSSRPAVSVLQEVRKEFEGRGPLSSADIDYPQTVDWSWAPTRLSRAVLESMYFWGELVIHHKVNTRKVYDLAVRHIPRELLECPDPNRTMEQYYDWYVLRRIGSIGLLWNRPGDAWLGIDGLKSAERNGAFERLLKRKQIAEVSVEGIQAPLYIRQEDMHRLDGIGDSAGQTAGASILAPLDNLLWDRRLIKELFDFEYRWEVYKPVSQREYGYYVLPVLYGDRFVARFEPGKDKQKGVFIIKNWWWEPGVDVDAELLDALAQCFKRFMNYLDVRELVIDTNVCGEKAGRVFLNNFGLDV